MSTVTETIVGALDREGVDFWCGVPCSYLKGLWAHFEGRPGFVSAVREDVALGLAAGAWFGGRTPGVLMQNSGLGTSLNVLTSLSTLYGLPAFLLVSWRGEGGKDAPEHVQMGLITPSLLELAGVPYQIVAAERVAEQVAELSEIMRAQRTPVALVVPKGTCE